MHEGALDHALGSHQGVGGFFCCLCRTPSEAAPRGPRSTGVLFVTRSSGQGFLRRSSMCRRKAAALFAC